MDRRDELIEQLEKENTRLRLVLKELGETLVNLAEAVDGFMKAQGIEGGSHDNN